MDKKLLTLMFGLIFMLSLVSAVRIDYTPNEKGVNDMKAVIKDTILFGLIAVGEQGTMELKSHNTIYEKRGVEINTLTKEVNPAGIGLIYETNFGNEHKDALTDVKIIDMRTGKEVERDWRFVYSSEGQWEIPIYKEICPEKEIVFNEYYEEEQWKETNCEWVFDYYKYKPRTIWHEYNSKNIPKGKFELGIEIEVKENDYLDIVLEVQGKRIDKHAQVIEGIADYIYSSGSGNNSIIKYDKDFNIVQVGEEHDYVISNLIQKDPYIYYSLASSNQIVKAYLSNLSVICYSDNNSGGITGLEVDEDYIYSAENVPNATLKKWYSNNLSLVLESDPMCDTCRYYALTSDEEYLYTGSSTDYIPYGKYYKTNLSIALQGDWTGGNTYSLFRSGDYLYVGTISSKLIRKVYSSNFSLVATSDECDINFYDMVVDDDYIYYFGGENNTLIKIYKDNLSFIETGVNYGSPYINMAADDDYIYYGGGALNNLIKINKTNVTQILINETLGHTIQTISLRTILPLAFSNLSPSNNINTTNTEIVFLVNVTDEDDLGIQNVSLVINDTIEQTNTSGVEGVYNFTETLSDGVYEWRIQAYDNDSELYESDNYTLTIDSTDPTIEAELNQSISYSYGENITLSYNITDANLDSCWYNYNETNISLTCGTDQEVNITTEEGYTNITVYANDTFGNEANESLSFNYSTIPPEIEILSPLTSYDYLYDNQSVDLNFTLETNGTLDTCWYSYNETNTTINCSENTTFQYDSTANNLTLYANDTLGNENSSSVEWSYLVLENSRNYTNQTYITSYNNYSINVTANNSLTAVRVYINDTSFPLVKRTGGVWNTSFDIPTDLVGNNTIKYGFTYLGETFNSTLETEQEIRNLTFILCGGDYTTTFLNLIFKDESNSSSLNASIPLSEFTYYLGTGTENKTYEYVNSSNNPSYAFCVSPTDEDLNVLPYVQYRSGLDYPQRIWNPDTTIYNSTVTNQILYLLSSTSGQYVTFQVTNIADQVLRGVEGVVYRDFSGVSTEVGRGTTGSDGSVTFWLNPDFVHTYTFSKEGYESVELSFAPTQTGYTVILGSEVSSVSDYTRGVRYYLYPTGTSLVNDTTYDFGMNLTSDYWDIDSYGFSLTYRNGTVIDSTSSSSVNNLITIPYNTDDLDRIIMDFYWVIEGNYTNGTRLWSIYNTENTQWSINTFITDLNIYLDTEPFGLDNFGRYLIIFIILFVSVGVLSYKYGLSSPLMIMSFVFLIVLFFDVIIGLIPSISIAGGVEVEHLLTMIAGILLSIVIIREVSL